MDNQSAAPEVPKTEAEKDTTDGGLDENNNNAPDAAAEQNDEAAAEFAAMFDLSKKKKKKKKKKNDDSGAGEKGAGASEADGSSTGEANYGYEALLDRIMNLLAENNPELNEKRRYCMKPPQLMKVGTKKTLWVNFQDICKLMRRNPEHVFNFFLAELGTEGSIDGNQRLVLRGKFVPKYIESLLRKYIVEYVTCQMCRSPNTTLTRDAVSRLHFVHCQDCGSSRSVAQIKTGYHAQTRADRRALRNAT